MRSEDQGGPAGDVRTSGLADFGWHPLDAWRILRRRIRPFLAVVGLIFLAGVLVSFRTTPQYRAASTVLIERQSPRTGTLQDAGMLVDGSWTQDYYQTQYRILQSRTLAERTIAAAGLGTRPGFREEDDPVEVFLRRLDVSPVHRSRIVSVAFLHPDPKVAAGAVNALVKEYIADSVERRVASLREVNRQLRKEADDLLARLDASERALQEFKRGRQLATADQKQNIATRRLDDAVAALSKAEEEHAQLRALAERSARGNGDADDLFRVRGVLESKVVQDLALEEARILRELAELAKRYKELHPSVIALEARLADTQAAIRREGARILAGLQARVEDAAAQVESCLETLQVRKREKLELDATIAQAENLKRTRDANQVLYENLLQRMKEGEVAGGLEITNISVVDPATPPRKPSKPNVPLNLAVGLGTGALLAAGLVLLLERIDVTVKTREEIEKLLGLPVIGMVPVVPPAEGAPETIAMREGRSAAAESFRAVRTALVLSPKGGAELKRILVTSSGPNEGKTCTSANLAATLARAGHRTLLVDADFHRPQVHRHLGVSNGRGLSDALVGDGPLGDFTQVSSAPNLWILPTGPVPPTPSELLGSPRMKERLEEAAAAFDRVVIDSPPVCAVTDACVVAPHIDGVVLVAQPGLTDRGGARRSVELLGGVGVRPVGVVLNRVPPGGEGFPSRYPYPYGGKGPEEGGTREA